METLTQTQEYNPPFSGEYSTAVAVASFVIGSVFFLGYILSPDDNILIAGFIYVIIAAFANTLILLHLLFLAWIKPGLRQQLSVRMLIVLANIPVAFFYFCYLFNPNLL
ncbi:hypothetical protein [Flavobacterium silvaticum]|uniref:Uncharacterized protein n=1 Tax=Flavobacterium silvaticum TaxID=1852020 RepID=A0A972G2Q3_9FLAO|nr:hypothetical protein [Flavobacterium silvaticum]NMH29391.1 hypothetical protein [Flavobacterium silvaticum]